MKYNTKIVLAYWKECGLPTPEVEYRFHPDRKWRFDFAFWETTMADDDEVGVIHCHQPGVALEVEGGIWTGGRHTRGSGFIKDMEKYNCAAVLGWRVLRCQPQDLCTNATVGLIERALAY